MPPTLLVTCLLTGTALNGKPMLYSETGCPIRRERTGCKGTNFLYFCSFWGRLCFRQTSPQLGQRSKGERPGSETITSCPGIFFLLITTMHKKMFVLMGQRQTDTRRFGHLNTGFLMLYLKWRADILKPPMLWENMQTLPSNRSPLNLRFHSFSPLLDPLHIFISQNAQRVYTIRQTLILFKSKLNYLVST